MHLGLMESLCVPLCTGATDVFATARTVVVTGQAGVRAQGADAVERVWAWPGDGFDPPLIVRRSYFAMLISLGLHVDVL